MKLNRFALLMVMALLLVGTMGAVVIRTGIAAANSVEDSETPIGGDALTQASTAALDHLGSGRVTETELGDEQGYYEVEVTLEDGRQVDVHLDENFNILSQESDAGLPDDLGETNDH